MSGIEKFHNFIRELSVPENTKSGEYRNATGTATNLSDQLTSIHQEWSSALITIHSETALNRYYSHQQLALQQMARDIIGCSSVTARFYQAAITGLFRHLTGYYSEHLKRDLFLHQLFLEDFLSGIRKDVENLSGKIASANMHELIRFALQDYLHYFHTGTGAGITYGQLFYFQNLYEQLSRIMAQPQLSDEDLAMFLLRSNFNHLALLNYYQTVIGEEEASSPGDDRKHFWLNKQSILLLQVRDETACFNDWPCLVTMLSAWFNERSQQIVTPAIAPSPGIRKDKIPLDISVAQLACMLKVCYDETVTHSTAVKHVLQFVCESISTKRQPEISFRSLSKAYYTHDPATAAFVLDLLDKMSGRLKRLYF